MNRSLTSLQHTEPVSSSLQGSASLGFTQRVCIHPAQINPIDQSFLPTADELGSARRRLEALEAVETSGGRSYRSTKHLEPGECAEASGVGAISVFVRRAHNDYAEASGVGNYLDNDGSMADIAPVRRARRLLDG
ncbi:MAG: hypothetical protein B5766_08145 [Candidatus Lumbricidophila eiseniae]|uniref:HpcH/HpaI aldolase/citrate lyase domain-containing protein n=1 Tax=Candidatus Lumbricidiphila eiseniae TaxID=1969409 RepID=A0A2A6FRN8_9MICO|nr:MAG: hypothetical protein B5766_08145 [Candidatus Lumbricidophila eiseniae]